MAKLKLGKSRCLIQVFMDTELKGRTRARAPDRTQCSSHVLPLFLSRKILQKGRHLFLSRAKLSVHIFFRCEDELLCLSGGARAKWSCLSSCHPTCGCSWRHGSLEMWWRVLPHGQGSPLLLRSLHCSLNVHGSNFVTPAAGHCVVCDGKTRL